jgi:hypothetical protein
MKFTRKCFVYLKLAVVERCTVRYARELFAVLRTSLASDVHLFAGVNL